MLRRWLRRLLGEWPSARDAGREVKAVTAPRLLQAPVPVAPAPRSEPKVLLEPAKRSSQESARPAPRSEVAPVVTTVSHPAYGVIALRFERGEQSTACYLCGESLLIDTGCAWARAALRETLSKLGADQSLRQVVNTHDHEGATGNNGLLAQMSRPRFFAHRLSLPRIRFPDGSDELRLAADPVVESDPVPERLQTGHCELEVVHLPGHAPGHLCLFEPGQRWLFSADLDGPGRRGCEYAEMDGPLWLASLDKAVALKPACLFDGRGQVAHEVDAAARLEHMRRFLFELQARILRVADEAQTIQDITRRVFGDSWLERAGTAWSGLAAAPQSAQIRLVDSFLRERRSLV